MLTESNPSLITLPVELFYHILDYLDINDILFLFRNVCRHFYEITNSYNRYTIKLVRGSCQNDIQRICRIVRPENVVKFFISNILMNIGELFSSLINIHQFTRLHTVHLSNIRGDELNQIIHHFATVPMLTSLVVKIQKTHFLFNDSLDFLSSIIAQSSLQKLHLYADSFTMYRLSWPNHCTLHELNIQKCTYQQFCRILDHSSNLQSLTLDDCDMSEIDQTTLSTVYRQLTLLKLKNTEMSINQIELLLTHLPSLIDLNITHWKSSLNFLQSLSQWEQFISQKLPLLEKFKCYIYILKYPDENIKDIEMIIAGFRTSFWLEHKRWFINCKYNKDASRSEIIFYSFMGLHTEFPDNLDHGILSYSSTMAKIEDATKMRSLCSIRLNLVNMMKTFILYQFQQPTQYIFQKINQLTLDINGEWPRRSLKLLSTLIDLTKLNEIYLFVTNNARLSQSTIKNLLERADKVNILGISYDNDTTINVNDICSVITHQIDHLKVRTKDIDCLKLILKHVEHLSSVTFIRHWSASSSWIEMIDLLNEKGRKFSINDDQRSIKIWFNKDNNEHSQIKTESNFDNLIHPHVS